ncbi:LysR family transcriptional regulator [Actinopolymorpha pittospori]|uniref:DNA-binding transcriptional LysR family regulator n=1 Tax=Actinopolymorpha pittospori TaxID=648752 RepID=A0A927RMK8_9ACTN|nr:DNA-binding transcriptional LysR family regulator [Actinopolymorpha pittospori]
MDLLAHLETFVAVAQERSFSRAAELLGIAQPLLSRRIKTLEQELGSELFDRSRRQIEITRFGSLLLPHAQDVLRRAEQLRSVARSAQTSAVQVLGVPPDCDAPALARVIRTAAERGVVVSVQDLPAQARADALADGTLTLALVRVPAGAAPLAVPLGLAAATPFGRRTVHLESLRPRRGTASGAEPALLVTPEDDLPQFVEHLRRAVARAGLPEGRVRVASSTAAALAETLAGTGLLLCTEEFARRNQVPWALLSGVPLRRGYQLAPEAPDWLLPLLGAAVGSVPDRRQDADDARVRLAVHA